MKGKKLIKIFLLFIALVCLWWFNQHNFNIFFRSNLKPEFISLIIHSPGDTENIQILLKVKSQSHFNLVILSKVFKLIYVVTYWNTSIWRKEQYRRKQIISLPRELPQEILRDRNIKGSHYMDYMENVHTDDFVIASLMQFTNGNTTSNLGQGHVSISFNKR